MLAVDVLTVLGPGQQMLAPTLAALRNQGEVALLHHQVVSPHPAECGSAIEAIVRARNDARTRGTAHFAMFLDRDVLLPAGAIEALLYGFLIRPHHAALAIRYLDRDHSLVPFHVAMGATLFYRDVLERIEFRAEPGLCECMVCCNDLRRMGYAIGYLPGLVARHLKGWSPCG